MPRHEAHEREDLARGASLAVAKWMTRRARRRRRLVLREVRVTTVAGAGRAERANFCVGKRGQKHPGQNRDNRDGRESRECIPDQNRPDEILGILEVMIKQRCAFVPSTHLLADAPWAEQKKSRFHSRADEGNK